MKDIELKRIEENNKGEVPELTKIIITAKNIKNVNEVLTKTKDVMKVVSQFAYTENWPLDEEWKEILPKWFVHSMTSKSLEEIMKNKGQWHFESWVANIKDRSWLWYSSKTEKNSLQFVLETLSIPYLYDTFIYILYSQGVAMNDIKVVDDIYN